MSLNWEKLQSKLSNTPIGRENKKSVSNRIGKRSKKSHILKKEEGDELSSVAITVVKKAILIEDIIEKALWYSEHDIKLSEIDKISVREKPDRDVRKRDPGKYVAMDCEFVGVGPDGRESALARISIVNFFGHVLLDKFVKPKERVTDWRTWVSGVTPRHMKEAVSFEEAQNEAAAVLEGRILVGHAIHHDLKALYLSHPRSKIRDTSQYKPFRQISKGKTPSLKRLTQHFLKIEIQNGQHSSVEDARATMLLFRMNKKDFENSMRYIK